MRIFRSPYFYIFLFALLLRFIWYVLVQLKNPAGFMFFDSWSYWRIAENLEKFGSFSQDGQTLFPDSSRTPAYPFFIYFLKKLGPGLNCIVITQLVISSATCVLSAFLSKELFENKKAGVFAGTLAALDFTSIFFSNTLLTETLFTFLMVLFFSFWTIHFKKQKTTALVAASLLLGIAVLCRPIAVYLPLVLSILLCFPTFQFIKIKKSLIFLAACYLVVFPWLARNHSIFGKPFLSTVGNTNLLFFTASGIKAEKDRQPLFQIQEEFRRYSLENYDWTKPEEVVKFSNFCRDESRKLILENPFIFLKQAATSSFHFFVKPLRNYIDYQLGFSKAYHSATGFKGLQENTSMPAIVLVFYQLLFLLAVYLFAILYLMTQKLRFTTLAILAIIIYFMLFSVFSETDARMRVPAMPFLILLAAMGMAMDKKNILKKKAAQGC